MTTTTAAAIEARVTVATYRGGLPVASIDDILDLAEQLRAQLAA